MIGKKSFGYLECYRLKTKNLILGCECIGAISYHKIWKKIILFREFKHKNQKLNENECGIKENAGYRARRVGLEIDKFKNLKRIPVEFIFILKTDEEVGEKRW